MYFIFFLRQCCIFYYPGSFNKPAVDSSVKGLVGVSFYEIDDSIFSVSVRSSLLSKHVPKSARREAIRRLCEDIQRKFHTRHFGRKKCGIIAAKLCEKYPGILQYSQCPLYPSGMTVTIFLLGDCKSGFCSELLIIK